LVYPAGICGVADEHFLLLFSRRLLRVSLSGLRPDSRMLTLREFVFFFISFAVGQVSNLSNPTDYLASDSILICQIEKPTQIDRLETCPT
jgi:hypothetical protein